MLQQDGYRLYTTTPEVYLRDKLSPLRTRTLTSTNLALYLEVRGGERE